MLVKGNVASGLVPGFSECTTSWGNKTLNQSHPDTGLHNVAQRREPRDATSRKSYEKMEVFTSHQLSLKEGSVKMAGTSMGAFPRVWLTFLPHSLGAFVLSPRSSSVQDSAMKEVKAWRKQQCSIFLGFSTWSEANCVAGWEDSERAALGAHAVFRHQTPA